MGEEAKKEEEPKVEAKAEEKKEEEKKEEKKEEEKKEEPKAEEEKKEEEKKTEEPPAPPPPVILQVDLHCIGCARKIERCILRCKGVEGVEVEMGKNLVTIKGIVDPEAVCKRIEKKTMRKAKIISPILPPPPPADQADAAAVKPQMVLSQVSDATTIELKVNMHCEACAQQLQRKIKKMRGVQNVETNLVAAQVKVTGTMTGEKLVEYIHRRTGKLATIIPPPPPPPPAEEKKEVSDQKTEEKAEENKDGDKPAEEGKEKSEEEKKEGEGKEEKGADDAKKEGEIVVATNNAIWHGGYMNHGFVNGGYTNPGYMNPGFLNGGYVNHEEEMAKRSMMINWMPMPAMAMPMPMHMPVYMFDQPPPPPQMFSDENPNACVIS
ncbi:hypothetical protein LUZ60_002278 [Juncus effusus]|nr:hypothetical protein LUZ60_002278 [Juncus effusus]